MSQERASFGSKIGMILATAGGAVGLGNVWRFPYMAGENGGAVFSLVWYPNLSSEGMVPPTLIVRTPTYYPKAPGN